VAERRRIWIDYRQPYMRRHQARLVFIDETSVNTKRNVSTKMRQPDREIRLAQ